MCVCVAQTDQVSLTTNTLYVLYGPEIVFCFFFCKYVLHILCNRILFLFKEDKSNLLNIVLRLYVHWGANHVPVTQNE